MLVKWEKRLWWDVWGCVGEIMKTYCYLLHPDTLHSNKSIKVGSNANAAKLRFLFNSHVRQDPHSHNPTSPYLGIDTDKFLVALSLIFLLYNLKQIKSISTYTMWNQDFEPGYPCLSVTDLTDVSPADEDSNWKPANEVNLAILGNVCRTMYSAEMSNWFGLIFTIGCLNVTSNNLMLFEVKLVAPPCGQIYSYCKYCHLVAKFTTMRKWHYIVAKFAMR